MSQVHPLARTTPRTRAEINTSPDSIAALSDRYNISIATARKWKQRDDVQDRSHRPHKLSTALTPGQETLVVELRRTLLLPLDDLLAITHEFINAAASRSGLDRCLRRHGVANLKDLQPEIEGEAALRRVLGNAVLLHQLLRDFGRASRDTVGQLNGLLAGQAWQPWCWPCRRCC